MIRREGTLSWRWTAWRAVISAFVLFHLSALIIWTIPPCELKRRLAPPNSAPYYYYVLPLGIWQWWAIFAPEPIKETFLLNAEVIDAKGLRHVFEFPRIGELPWYRKLAKYRQPKFTANMNDGEFLAQREFAARHAVRQLNLTEDSFPAAVSLYYELKPAPPPGTWVTDPMERPRIHVIQRYQFATPKEVHP
jgi:hypothetical protein